jgi:hypothetical protein
MVADIQTTRSHAAYERKQAARGGGGIGNEDFFRTEEVQRSLQSLQSRALASVGATEHTQRRFFMYLSLLSAPVAVGG